AVVVAAAIIGARAQILSAGLVILVDVNSKKSIVLPDGVVPFLLGFISARDGQLQFRQQRRIGLAQRKVAIEFPVELGTTLAQFEQRLGLVRRNGQKRHSSLKSGAAFSQVGRNPITPTEVQLRFSLERTARKDAGEALECRDCLLKQIGKGWGIGAKRGVLIGRLDRLKLPQAHFPERQQGQVGAIIGGELCEKRLKDFCCLLRSSQPHREVSYF